MKSLLKTISVLTLLAGANLCPSSDQKCLVCSGSRCLACGDACGEGEACCGERGCIALGTDTDCLTCSDACDADPASSDREFCNGPDGCQTACGAVGWGYITTDWPPRIFKMAFDQWRYTHPDTGVEEATVCETSDDCTACPSTILNGTKTVEGCGCLKRACANGVDSSLFINFFQGVPADSYVCVVFYND